MGVILTDEEYHREKERLLAALYVFKDDTKLVRKIEKKLFELLKIRNLSDYEPIQFQQNV